MFYTQFSLSPNSSNDFDLTNSNYEDISYCDQATLSITSDKTMEDLDLNNESKFTKFKVDPFLSDFMTEDVEDYGRQSWLEPYPELYESNVFTSTEYDLDYLSVTSDNLEIVPPELLDWDILLPPILSPINQEELHYITLPTKHRRVQVSCHERCDEWINKYHDLPDTFLSRANGTVDHRKTTHHKILNDCDTDGLFENNDFKRKKNSIYMSKRSSSFQNNILNLSSSNSIGTISRSSFSHKLQRICSVNRNIILKPFNPHTCSEDNNIIISSTYIQSEVTENKLKNEVVPKMQSVLKMGKRVFRRGHRLSLWQFLMCLLDSNKYRENRTGIKWIDRNNGIFHIIDSKQVATLWGVYKERRERMTYDSLARSLRHYYKKNLVAKINNRRLVYQIAQECIQWSSDTYLKKNK